MLTAFAAVVAGPVPAPAAVSDCAPLARPARFSTAQDAELRDYDRIEFTAVRGGAPVSELVAGPTCYQVYAAEDGAGTADVGAVRAHYRERLAELGAQILFADRSRIHARLGQGDGATWFRLNVQDGEVDVTVLRQQPLTPTLTRPAGHDHRLLGHMPLYREAAVERQSDAVRSFSVPDRRDRREVEVRGAVHEARYEPIARDRLSSDVEIQENYRLALRERGADILASDWQTTVARLVERGRLIWVRVTSQVAEITVLVVESRLPAPAGRPADAALKRALDRDGRAILASGLAIGPAMLRADPAAVGQTVRLMRRDKALALAVVVHTDDLGDRAVGLQRSRELAETMLEAIVKQGIARERVSAIGAGPDRPVADNATEAGRSANRRIELVRNLPR